MTELENNYLLIVQVSALIGLNPVLPMECKEPYNCFAACPLLYSQISFKTQLQQVYIFQMCHVIKYAVCILLFEQYCLHQKNGNKNWKIFLTASSHKEDERENLMKAQFSKGCLKLVARGKLTLVIVLCKACLHVSSVVKGLYACAVKITNAYMVPFSLLSCQHVNSS